MFEHRAGGGEPLSTAEIASWVPRLAGAGVEASDAERIDRIRALEEAKAALAAAQAREVAEFAASQRAAQQARGVRAADAGRGVASQVALATRMSVHAAARFTGFARVLVAELPHTLAALTAGVTTERRAFLVAQHTVWLDAADRAVVDAAVGPRLGELSDRQVEAEVRKLAYALDPVGYTKLQRRAESERRVTLRPAPDTMTRLTALLPVAAGVACYAALRDAAASGVAAGDPRSRGQLMADTLVDAITGATTPATETDAQTEAETETVAQAAAPAAASPADATSAADASDAAPAASDAESACDAPGGDDSCASRPASASRPPSPARPAATPQPQPYGLPAGAGVEIQILMTDRTLLGLSDEPAHVHGYGPVPAPWVRDLLRRANDTTRIWLRRLFTAPETGALAAIESRRREFPAALRTLVIARDQFCRTPWCGAPIRHIDHIQPHATGGPTSLPNAQGVCEACNYAKQAPDWHAHPAEPVDGATPAAPDVVITTPTGHQYVSRPPDPPGRPLEAALDPATGPPLHGALAARSPTATALARAG